ncbi:hypothetical protein FOL47_001718 [Perkinsus chesapeaki]|uniref:Methyltransferase FkbM domain-containing protein n=1 Tax=Perkinsus chesapeaki TaxID=330153 RepID=A0A7J6MHN8_PERCH|nr:hypothetical protein FOL47_001718 [Perkinsus chesapeaki]
MLRSFIIPTLGSRALDTSALEGRLSALEAAADANFQSLGDSINALSMRIEELAQQWALEFEQYKAYHESMQSILANLTYLADDLRRDKYNFPRVVDRLLESIDSKCPAQSYAAPVKSSLLGVERSWQLCVKSENDRVDNMVKWEASAPDCERLFFGMTSLDNTSTTVLDIGANIGLCSSLYAAYGFTVTSVEPNGRNADLLEASVSLNDFVSHVEVLRAAVSSRLGEATLFEPDGNTGGTRVIEVTSNTSSMTGRLLTARTVTLADILSKQLHENIFMKLDCEGCEYEVLASIEGILASGKVPRIMLEFAPSLLIQHSPLEAPMMLLELMHRTGFTLFKLPFARERAEVQPSVFDRNDFGKVIAMATKLSMIDILVVHEDHRSAFR